ncbi:SusD/RagB family nutrient-binding outer membrane lipoprotein [Lunatimonas salinarum]|uniref:SusD/RagB family nutrient-binding outer membrane lipoprotein n=1 Tax=Lunatimonas salinarum TaxID=1774590 RepID=UPI001ADFB04A|nr:SusD/RagB family nutrient-binding outer membrane lipoprotein [Lunatimonas salinarum]
MKFKNMQRIVLLIGMIGILSSCSDEILNQIDTNPNAPVNVSVDLLLPQATMGAVYGVGGNFTMNQVSFIVEHTSNVSVNNVIDPFFIASSLWENSYLALNDLQAMIERAEQDGFYTYLGIGQVLTAYIFSQLTDVYGDIPMTEALKGSAIRNPKFDSQETVYNELFGLLDRAITNLERESVDNPGNLDLIFSGDKSMWIKTAYGLKARLHNRLSLRDPEGSAIAALEAIANSFSNSDEAFVFSGYQQGTAFDNPWTGIQKPQQIFGISTTILEVMEMFSGSLSADPRSDKWFSKIDGEIIGGVSGQTVADPNHVLYSAPSTANVLTDHAPQPLLMYDELKFIESEALLRLNRRSEAYDAYLAGVRAALEKEHFNEDEIAEYMALPAVDKGIADFRLEDIVGQKYISFWMFLPLEAFNDWRRTQFPEMKNERGTFLRLPYPTDELSRNSNTPTDINEVAIYNKPLWWAAQE